MKAILFLGDTNSEYLSRDELLEPWIAYFKENEIDYTISGSFQSSKADELLSDVDVALGIYIQNDIFTKELLSRHPNLKYISTFAHGYGRFDKDYCKKNDITVTNTIYGSSTIAEFTMALLLEILHHASLEASFYKDNLKLHKVTTNTCTRQMELYEKTVGVIGLGEIGYQFSKMVHAFNTKVISYSRHKKEGKEYDFIEQTSLDDLLERSDIISIHCPLTDETNHLINQETISKMKDGVILLNTARGDIIDENALVEALRSRKIYAAGLDVVSREPRSESSVLFECDNAIITSHIAWLPIEARKRTMKVAIENFDNWLKGKPTSVIN